jgi:hypothetical protein
MRGLSILVVASVVGVSVLAACGGARPEPAAPAASTEPPATAAATKEEEFDDLPVEKKAEIMRTKVVPTLGALFKEHDAREFASFGCATCHGPKKDKSPQTVLPKLHLSNGGYGKLARLHPETVAFMANKVVPAMAEILHEPVWDPATKKGFGCAGCHAVD